ncbi:DUF7282 domain-containing protein [Halovivax limisalsi]|uniref:DUF7282 domain-containing protein n=1 Tax=Halovivax limisalsi TaxID=1453760 RepID=UPI001FFD427C|nr:hypothetical protein [Halovivax limisalsi]
MKRSIALLAVVGIVVGAGFVVGQAPALFGAEVTEDPYASISFPDQDGNGSVVTVESVTLSEGGYVVITDERDTVVGVSDRLSAGEHANVTVSQADDVDRELVGRLTATVYRDRTDEAGFDRDPDEGQGDRPYIVDGYPVSETATVTDPDRDATAADSFAIRSLSAPERATTNGTINVSANVTNPTGEQLRQSVELRLGGDLFGRQVFALDPEETREVTFEVDPRNVAPGNYTLGVYTATGGELSAIEIVYDGPPRLSILSANESAMTVDVGVPDGGFVAVVPSNESVDAANVSANESGWADVTDESVLATSEELEPGLHEGVEIEYDLDGLANGSTNGSTDGRANETADDARSLTAIVYAGTPDDLDAATPYDRSGHLVAETVALREADE